MRHRSRCVWSYRRHKCPNTCYVFIQREFFVPRFWNSRQRSRFLVVVFYRRKLVHRGAMEFYVFLLESHKRVLMHQSVDGVACFVKDVGRHFDRILQGKICRLECRFLAAQRSDDLCSNNVTQVYLHTYGTWNQSGNCYQDHMNSQNVRTSRRGSTWSRVFCKSKVYWYTARFFMRMILVSLAYKKLQKVRVNDWQQKVGCVAFFLCCESPHCECHA